LDDHLQNRTARVTFVHVPGHSGDPGNDRGDYLDRMSAVDWQDTEDDSDLEDSEDDSDSDDDYSYSYY
jgi:ribonuclease HI